MEPTSLREYYEGGPRTLQDAFPPACLRTHWDPTMLTSHVLPQGKAQHDLSLDPRPATKICFTYYHTSAGDAPLAPNPPTTLPSTPSQFLGGPHRPHASGPPAGPPVIPPGGQASRGFSYAGFHSKAESDLQLLSYPLTRCATEKYLPPGGPPASMSTQTLPNVRLANDGPLAPMLPVNQPAGCREADDAAAWARSDRLFFNPTRYDRTNMVPAGLKQAKSRGAESQGAPQGAPPL